jgi:hypothetical protein
MIAHILRVWPGEKVTMIIVRDTAADQKESACFVFLPEGQWIAALCDTAAWNGKTQPAPLVLTLEPKTRYGYKIIEAELLPETRMAIRTEQDADQDAQIADETPTPTPAERLYPSAAEVQLNIDLARGKQWKDL